jgi:hypothetical protein
MLIPKLETLDRLEHARPVSRPSGRIAVVPSYRIYRNGVLHDVVDGPESHARNRTIGLCNLEPDSSWDYLPAT